MVRRWSGYYKKKILNLLPIDGSRVRSKDVHAKARRMGIGPNTVQNYLNMLVGEGSVKQIAERPKEVYYCRREDVRMRYLINDFMQEIDNTLSQLPVELHRVKSRLIEGGLTETEGRRAIEDLRGDPQYLRSLVIDMLLVKVIKMFKATFPPEVKDKDFYLGYFDNSLQFVWRSEVEAKTRTQRSAKS